MMSFHHGDISLTKRLEDFSGVVGYIWHLDVPLEYRPFQMWRGNLIMYIFICTPPVGQIYIHSTERVKFLAVGIWLIYLICLYVFHFVVRN